MPDDAASRTTWPPRYPWQRHSPSWRLWRATTSTSVTDPASDWLSSDALGTAAIITGVVALVLVLSAGWLGGRLGENGIASETQST